MVRLQQVKGVSQNINYTTIALLPVLTSLFDHISQHQFGDDVLCESCYHGIHEMTHHSSLLTLRIVKNVHILWTGLLTVYVRVHVLLCVCVCVCVCVCSWWSVDDLQMSCYRIMCAIYSLGSVKNPHVER